MNNCSEKNSINFANTWNEYKDSLMSFIVKKSRCKTDAEDIQHDVFIKTYLGLESIRDKNKIKQWIFQVTNNTIADFYRKLSKEETGHLDEQHDESEFENSKDESYKLIPLINSLPQKYRELLILADIKGLPQKEIAEILDLSVSATKSRVQRGRKLLKERMLECCSFKIDKYGNIVECEEKPAYKKYKNQSPDKKY
ncbi:sigma-70 family RNA polymerase sigma factor [Bacteroidota bacterium]